VQKVASLLLVVLGGVFLIVGYGYANYGNYSHEEMAGQINMTGVMCIVVGFVMRSKADGAEGETKDDASAPPA
jgi:hypothetical protein